MIQPTSARYEKENSWKCILQSVDPSQNHLHSLIHQIDQIVLNNNNSLGFNNSWYVFFFRLLTRPLSANGKTPPDKRLWLVPQSSHPGRKPFREDDECQAGDTCKLFSEVRVWNRRLHNYACWNANILIQFIVDYSRACIPSQRACYSSLSFIFGTPQLTNLCITSNNYDRDKMNSFL